MLEAPQSRRQPGRAFALGREAVLGLCVLFAFAWLGEGTRRLGVGPPGPVIGLALLAAGLSVSERRSGHLAKARRAMTPVCRGLIRHLGLLFVPAGVGVMTQAATLKAAWPALLAGLVGSTLVGLVVTGWLMQALSRRDPEAPRP